VKFVEREHAWSVEASIGELRGTVTQLVAETADMRQEFRSDIRRLDERTFQLMLLQLGTLATALASLVAALAS
jgi:hypothetical protein